eukprot:CAMPEP_0119406016 /NCGR_PEP_ID=MMETSP1335-20130426/506_1 /TAXON_ID=259385 /ORGANISM="Chrysoculter rhomboideus, Strain RCC1486" /LENGTH=230 /DNA_ID=CAMNT_0007430071 /DNA_START=110 /DNA_END=800 /DNA_ORIENTATION=-
MAGTMPTPPPLQVKRLGFRSPRGTLRRRRAAVRGAALSERQDLRQPLLEFEWLLVLHAIEWVTGLAMRQFGAGHPRPLILEPHGRQRAQAHLAAEDLESQHIALEDEVVRENNALVVVVTEKVGAKRVAVQTLHSAKALAVQALRKLADDLRGRVLCDTRVREHALQAAAAVEAAGSIYGGHRVGTLVRLVLPPTRDRHPWLRRWLAHHGDVGARYLLMLAWTPRTGLQE